jgi:hypothetical protein
MSLMSQLLRIAIFPIAVCFCLLFPARQAVFAQEPQIIRAEAWPGSPFGVGKIVFRTGSESRLIQATGALTIRDAESRLLYPAWSDGLLSLLLNRPGSGGMQTVWFLFRGDQPLKITLSATSSVTFDVTPQARRPVVANMNMQQWWRQFEESQTEGVLSGNYPPLVETYLASMLQRRLDIRTPPRPSQLFGEGDKFQQTVNLLFDVDSIRAESIRDLMTEPPSVQAATMALPPPVEWPRSTIQVAGDDVIVEAIARFVPEECFYLRFGNWNNQLWLKKLLLDYGGDLSTMISLQAYKKADSQKMLDQLVLESSQIDDWFGGNLVEDVAVIGTDLYVEDGPSNAVLLLAKGPMLERQIRSRREAFAEEHAAEGVTLQTVDIAGHEVSLLSTPDNRIRSFHVIHDLCHITSSSRYIVERFLQAAHGDRSLALLPEFRYARQTLPLEHDHTVFIYLSRPFFQNLLSPAYQIELARRNRSLANIQLLQLAQWSAMVEGYADDDIDKMILNGFLPENFNQLPDGSSSNWIDGAWHDSLRGLRGSYLPIPDVPVAAITPAESEWLAERMDFFRNQLRDVDPMLIGCKRFDLGNNVERVAIDARLAPFGKEKYGWLGKVLGPPLQVQFTGAPDDLISVQASLAGNMFTRSNDPHQLFLAIQSDIPPRTNLQPTSFVELYKLLRTTPGYLGAWPNPGYLDSFPALGGQPDAEGYTYSQLLDLWRLQYDEYAVISFDKNRLQAARGWIQAVPAEYPAQLRVRIGDVANSNLRPWANVLFYERAWEASVANVRLINLLIQQMGVPPETALAQVEQLLGVKLLCPLGGEYVFSPMPNGNSAWQSTAWPSFDDPQIPAEYLAPLMTWFRGMTLDVYQRDTLFVVHATLDIQRGNVVAVRSEEEEQAGGLLNQIPGFNLFKGFSKVEELPPPIEAGDLPSGSAEEDDLKAPGGDKQVDKR